MINTPTSCKCPKCGGSGKLDWTSNDGGICYKCEGLGYLGEKPEGFNKQEKEVREAAKTLLIHAIYGRRLKGQNICLPTYELYPQTAKTMLDQNISFNFKYSNFWMNVPEMTINFGGGFIDDVKYSFTLIVGGEFLKIKATII